MQSYPSPVQRTSLIAVLQHVYESDMHHTDADQQLSGKLAQSIDLEIGCDDQSGMSCCNRGA
jgi:hypothetical protein